MGELNNPETGNEMTLWRRKGDCITEDHLSRLSQEGWRLVGVEETKSSFGIHLERGTNE